MSEEKNILDVELNEEEAKALAEEIQSWKESFASKLEEEAEAKLQARLDELDEQNNIWREEVAEAYSDKFLAALDEMREDVRAEVLAESVEADPVHKVMDSVVKLVAPLMNEEYAENTYRTEIKKLTDQLNEYKRAEELAEGAKALEELIEGYDDSFKPALRKLIGEGTEEEVTARFESIIESLADNDEDDFEDYEDFDEEEDFDLDDFEIAEDEEQDEEIDEDFADFDELSTIEEDDEEDDEVDASRNVLRESLQRLI